MPTTLFTLGYEKRTVGEFIALLQLHAIDVLIDVRETAWSHKRGFSKQAFARALADVGIGYVHAQFAGNPKWLRSTAESHAECLSWYAWYLDEFTEILDTFEHTVDELHRRGKRVCITCFERHAEDCHRSLLALAWQERGDREVTHLATEGCRRLVTS